MKYQLSKIICLILCATLILPIIPVEVVRAEGWNTVQSISTAQEFFSIMDNPNGSYRLETNLNLGQITPIGSEYEEAFCGTLDGNGHTISYTMVASQDIFSYGLFYCLEDADISNLQLAVEMDLQLPEEEIYHVGILAGQVTTCTLDDVSAKGAVQITGSMNESCQVSFGGLIGKNLLVGTGVGFGAEATATNCKVDIQAKIQCGSIEYYGILDPIDYLYADDQLQNCHVAGDVWLNGMVYYRLLNKAKDSYSSQNLIAYLTNASSFMSDLYGNHNSIGGKIELYWDAINAQEEVSAPVSMEVLSGCFGSRFYGTVHIGEFPAGCPWITAASTCFDNTQVSGLFSCDNPTGGYNFTGFRACEESSMDITLDVKCAEQCDILLSKYDRNTQIQYSVDVVGAGDDANYVYFKGCVESENVSLSGKANFNAAQGVFVTMMEKSSCCVADGSINDNSVSGKVAFIGSVSGQNNLFQMDIDVQNYVIIFQSENNSRFEGSFNASEASLIQLSSNCVVKCHGVTQYGTNIMVGSECSGYYGSLTASNVTPFTSYDYTYPQNCYINADLTILSDDYFNASSQTCRFDGSVTLNSPNKYAEVHTDTPATVTVLEYGTRDKTQGNLYVHNPHGAYCDGSHSLYSNTHEYHYDPIFLFYPANNPTLEEVTATWPEHLKPEYTPPEGPIQLSLHKTPDCMDSDKINNMLYSCGNFSWVKTTEAEEPEKTNYDTCYLKVDTSGIGENDLIQLITLSAPEGFSFSANQMVTVKNVNQAASISGMQVIPIYPIYTESEPTASEIEFLINDEPCSTGTTLTVNPDAGRVFMRSSFDAAGTRSWTDQMTPDFSGLATPSSIYDRGLAQISAAFAAAVYKYNDIETTLKNFGYSNIYHYNYHLPNDQIVTESNRDKVAATFATKRMVIGGEIKTVVAIVIRGTVSEEWYGNFDIKTGDRHSGFEKARSHMEDSLLQYLTDYTTGPANTKIMVTGHSRGAAVADLVGASLNNQYKSVFAEPVDIFTYTFASPNNTKVDQCNNVFNIINPYDIVTQIPSGFNKVGTNYYISTFQNKHNDAVWEKFNKITDNTQTFLAWDELRYPMLKKIAGIVSRYSDLPLEKTTNSIKNYLNSYISPYDNMEFLFGLKEDIEKEWSDDTQTTGDAAAAAMLTPSSDAPPEAVQYVMNRIWCNHAMEYYYSWMITAPASVSDFVEDLEHPYCYVSVRCPVDVNVYDDNGELIASIVNDQVVVGQNETCAVYEEEKYFLLEGTNFRFDVTGYDSGTMDISVTEFDEYFEKKSISTFHDLAIGKSETMNLHYDQTAQEAQEKCYVTTTSGSNVYPEYKTEDELINHQITVEVSGTGSVMGDGSYVEGEMVILRAIPAEDFLGWYENGKLVSQKADFTFECIAEKTLTALFSDGTQPPVSGDDLPSDDPSETVPPETEPEPSEPDQPAQKENPFVDVQAGKFYETPVLWAVEKEITKGIDETHFAPDATCNRGQVVTFLWRAQGSPEPTSGNNPFTDVKEGKFYYKAVLWAVEKGITSGTSATTFSPDASCTRGQVATFLWRTLGKPAASSSTNPFTDVSQGKFYYDAVLWAAESGVTSGMTKTTFAPDNTCTRGQIVTFLYRALG